MKAVYFFSNPNGDGKMIAARSLKHARSLAAFILHPDWLLLTVLTPPNEQSAEQFAASIANRQALISRFSPAIGQSYKAAVAIAVFDRFVLRNVRVKANAVRRAVRKTFNRLQPAV